MSSVDPQEIRVDRSQLYRREGRLEYGVQDGRYFSVYRGRVTGIEPDSAAHRWLDAHRDRINSLLTWVDETAPIKERDVRRGQGGPIDGAAVDREAEFERMWTRRRDSAAAMAPARDRGRSR
ncbi:hypothetical protein [Nocardia vulneris]|uniref:hypothetical protein n=1 Tax=Nocardia vulneris TaxID=1141657 RepID=UPI0012E01D33|nr:hypothetical protein [Nocardia vulneris]